ncbi:MAG TPA: transglutaminase domain-containing protein [Fimbriimonadaceae bacterium]
MLKWSVTGTPAKPYSILFTMGPDSYTWTNFTGGTGTHSGWVTFTMPLDGSIPIKVQLDPANVAGDTTTLLHTASSSFVPVPPTIPTNWYDPQEITASETASVTVPLGTRLTEIQMVLGHPITGICQEVLSVTPPAGAVPIVIAPFGAPAYETTFMSPGVGTYTAKETFSVRQGNFRANSSLVDCTWANLSSLNSSFAPDLASDNECEANDPSIAAFVATILPANYKTSMTPLAAARKLFQAVAARIRYVTPATDDAVTVLKNGVGDCGGYSCLYVACLRHIGIPARPVNGWIPTGWHCWTEIYTPKGGWIPQDCCFCSTASKGSYAFYFMIMPDLNSRVCISRGSQFLINGSTVPFLEEGLFWCWGTGNPVCNTTYTLQVTGHS